MTVSIKYKPKFWPFYKTIKNIVQMEEAYEQGRVFFLLSNGTTLVISNWNNCDIKYPESFSNELWKEKK